MENKSIRAFVWLALVLWACPSAGRLDAAQAASPDFIRQAADAWDRIRQRRSSVVVTGRRPTQRLFEPVRKPALEFSFAESRAVFKRFYQPFQPRITYPWIPQPSGGALGVMIRGNDPHTVHVPQSFLDKTMVHIETILADGHAFHIVPIDFSHGHLDIAEEAFQGRLGELWEGCEFGPFMEAALADPRLRIIYHTQEFIEPKAPPRELLGTYGEEARIVPIDILPLRDRLAVRTGHRSVFGVQFAAHPDGAFALKNGTRFDFSFEEEVGGPMAFLPRIGVIFEPPSYRAVESR